MSRRKDKERAKHFLYRNGQRIPRGDWDKHQRELKEMAEVQRLKAMGLSPAKPKIAVVERIGLERAQKRIITPDELRR